MDPKRQAVLQLLSQDSAYEEHFFKTKKNPVWFYALKEKGYFDPKKNPSVQPADKEGYYIIPQWKKSRFGSSLVDADLATKLLPKFFNKDASPEDLKKGELIIDYLTEIK